jgi:hypothetical protein
MDGAKEDLMDMFSVHSISEIKVYTEHMSSNSETFDAKCL